MKREVFEQAVKVAKNSGSKVTPAIEHATMLHLVYDVPVSDCLRGAGANDNSRNSVYSFEKTIVKTVKFMEEI